MSILHSPSFSTIFQHDLRARLLMLSHPLWLKVPENGIPSMAVSHKPSVMVAERMVGEQPAAPSIEVQSLRSDAQEDAFGGRHTVWRVTTSVEREGETNGNDQQVAYVREYFVKAEAELPENHDGILALMDENPIPSAGTGEPKAFYSKKKDDCYRFPAERATGDAKRQAPMIQKVLKTAEVPQVQYMGEIGDVSVVTQRSVPTTQTAQTTGEVPDVQFLDPVTWWTSLWVPQTTEGIVEIIPSMLASSRRLTSLSPRMREETIEVVDYALQERMQNDAVEHVVDVPVTGRRVFIMDDSDELIPEWLNFVKGVIDSEDLPLNVYRETLLQNKILRVIKKKHVTKYLEMLAEIAEQKDDYKVFYKQIGRRLKLGIHEDSTVGVKTAEVLRFNTSKPGHEQFSFDRHVDYMKEEQNDISYITGEGIAVVSSWFEENLRKKGHEVPYMADPVDEYAVYQFKEFGGKMLKSTTKEGLDLGDHDEKNMPVTTRVRDPAVQAEAQLNPPSNQPNKKEEKERKKGVRRLREKSGRQLL